MAGKTLPGYVHWGQVEPTAQLRLSLLGMQPLPPETRAGLPVPPNQHSRFRGC
jgi:hypothetical protein